MVFFFLLKKKKKASPHVRSACDETSNNLLTFEHARSLLYVFRKLVTTFFNVKNTSKLINQQLKNGVKIVN